MHTLLLPVQPSACVWSSISSTTYIEARALRRWLPMVADLEAAAVEVESHCTLALAGLLQKEEDYSASGPILRETRGLKGCT
ncbi:hypothetical protein C1H46_013148 [Malus baccata]|uniref:Uncharacterized protein n=1 Tax=Malus baccata TaxID=106549 RepID=A0A540MR40_MALBA|nr:hypothetical protein C1H46_013148 [Malus baccata]